MYACKKYVSFFYFFFLILFCSLNFISCITIPPHSAKIWGGIPDKIKNDIPFIAQTKNYCGPASLAMVLKNHNLNISMEKIASKIFLPEKKGTFAFDLLSGARRNGFLTFKINEFNKLLKEVSKGNPIIILQNLAFSWYPKWHFAVVVGYDLTKKTIILHSGRIAFHEMNMTTFIRTWKRSNYWALLILPPEQLSPSQAFAKILEETYIQEKIKNLDQAEKAYKKLIDLWPNRYETYLSLANLFYNQKKYSLSIQILKRGLENITNNPFLAHNLAFVYQKIKNIKKAKKWAKQSLKWATENEKKQLSDSLKEIL